jgi:CRISPR system Cascade subunit CasD
MRRHLVLRLASPLIAFGGETIDSYGVIRDFPALSMLTGMIANALGWDRGEAQRHQRLQERLRMGTVLEPSARRLRDYQTAELLQHDSGWTTYGEAEGRKNSPSYAADAHGRKVLTQQRYRDYHADLRAWVAFRLEPAEETPTLDDVAAAFDRPARPLFIGRKPCLPTDRLVAAWQEADDLLGALRALVSTHEATQDGGWRAQWCEGEGTPDAGHRLDVCDERDWTSGLHGGWRPVHEGLLRSREVAS